MSSSNIEEMENPTGLLTRCFCPHSCNFSGSVKSLIDHVKHFHNVPVHKFRYNKRLKLSISPWCQYTILAAEDNRMFVLWSCHDPDYGARLLWLVSVCQPDLSEPDSSEPELAYHVLVKGYDYIEYDAKCGPIKKIVEHVAFATIVNSSTLENRAEEIKIKQPIPSKLHHPISGDLNVHLTISAFRTFFPVRK